MRRGCFEAGFTLIEIAIVLVVVGLLLGGAVVGIKPVVESSKNATTTSRLDRIELALLAHVMQNGCLPCPATGTLPSTDANAGWSHSDADYYGPNGPANRPCAGPTGTACNANGGAAQTMGIVPWNTLGLQEADTVDAWNNRIAYEVDPTLVANAGSSMVRTEPASYPAGTLSVNNNSAQSQTTAAAYVLVSSGRDRSHAFSAGSGTIIADPHSSTTQSPNNPAVDHSATAFRQDTVNLQDGTSYFDDVVRYRTAANIIRDCGRNACGNPQ